MKCGEDLRPVSKAFRTSTTETTTTSRVATVAFRSGRSAERRSRATESKSAAVTFGPSETTAGSYERTRSGRSANRDRPLREPSSLAAQGHKLLVELLDPPFGLLVPRDRLRRAFGRRPTSGVGERVLDNRERFLRVLDCALERLGASLRV